MVLYWKAFKQMKAFSLELPILQLHPLLSALSPLRVYRGLHWMMSLSVLLVQFQCQLQYGYLVQR